MKIAFLSFFSGEIYRGGETFVHELANRLADYGHEVTVYQNGPKVTGAKYKSVCLGLKVNWQAKSGGLPFVNYWSLLVKRFTQEVLAKIGPETDIVVPTNGQWESILCKLWAVKNHKKMVISGQSGVGFDDRVNLYTFPDAFVPISSYALVRSKARNPFIRYTYIPNGADLEKFKPNGSTYSLKLKRPIILTVGALVKQKRIDLIIKAVARLPEASLLIVGEGSQQNSLLALANKLIPGRFEFQNVKHNQMPEIYRAADLFALLPYSSEAFGIVYVEAMASGLPAIAPNDEARREIVGQGGILIDHPGVPEDIAFGIKSALEQNWGDKPRKQAEKFSWDEIARKYEKLFKELI